MFIAKCVCCLLFAWQLSNWTNFVQDATIDLSMHTSHQPWQIKITLHVGIKTSTLNKIVHDMKIEEDKKHYDISNDAK